MYNYNMSAVDRQSAFDAALKYLTYRMRSESEVRKKLDEKGYEPQEIDETVEKLKQYKYIDDEAFALELMRSKTAARPIGKRKLKGHFYKAGISDEHAQIAMDAYSPESEQAACDAQFDKLAAQKGTDRAGLAKIQRALLSRGFGYEQINSSMRRYNDEYID